MRLTKKAMESIPVTGQRQIFFDDDLPGLAIRVSEIGRISFYFVYRYGKGRAAIKRWLNIGVFPSMTPEQARQKVKSLAAEVVMGGDPVKDAKDAKNSSTVADLAGLFFEQHVEAKLKAASQRLYRGIINNHILPNLGKLKIEAVTHKEVARLHHALREAPYMANRTAAVLSKFFNWCEVNGYRERHSNPADGLEKFKEQKRMEFLQTSDLEKIGQALISLEAIGQVSPLSAAAIRLLLLTGARLEEVLSLKWSYIDLKMALANLPDSKTGFKVLHLPAPAVEILQNLPRFNNEYVFASEESSSGHLSSLRRPWTAICERAQLKGWRIHDLRHAFASAAVNSGASLPFIGKLLGHTNASTTARYAHVAENPAHKLAEETAANIFEAISKKTGVENNPSNGNIIQFKTRQMNGE